MDRRTRRSPARFLAPLALIAVLGAFLAIINASGNTGSSSSGTDTATSSATSTTKTTSGSKTTVTKKKSAAATTYTIQVGDTLGGIADKTGVPLETLQELNPDVDPHAMTAGQKIKLK